MSRIFKNAMPLKWLYSPKKKKKILFTNSNEDTGKND